MVMAGMSDPTAYGKQKLELMHGSGRFCLALRREGQGGEGKAREEKGRGGVGGCGRVGHLVARCSAVCRFRWGDLVESWSCEANI